MRGPAPFLVFPLVALVIGFLFASQRPREPVEEEPLAPLGLPSAGEYGALLVDGADLYVGTERGVFMSRGGTEWRLSGLDGERVRALALVRGSIYAETDRGIARQAPTGWVPVRKVAPRVRELLARSHAVDPRNPKRLLDPGPVLRLSTDGGKTWREVLEASGAVSAAAWSTTQPDVAYAVAGDGQLYRSDDGGAGWLVAG